MIFAPRFLIHCIKRNNANSQIEWPSNLIYDEFTDLKFECRFNFHTQGKSYTSNQFEMDQSIKFFVTFLDFISDYPNKMFICGNIYIESESICTIHMDSCLSKAKISMKFSCDLPEDLWQDKAKLAFLH